MAYYIDDAKKTAVKIDGKSIYGWNRNRATLAAMREAERIAEDPEVPGCHDRASLQKSLES